MSNSKSTYIPNEITVAGISMAGALLGLAIAKAMEIETTKPVLFGGFFGTVLGTYIAKNSQIKRQIQQT